MQDRDQFLAEATKVIRDNFRATDSSGAMIVAAIAPIVIASPCGDFREAGFKRFTDVIRALEQQSVLKMSVNSNGVLAVTLIGQMSESPPSPQVTATAARRRPLKKMIWIAFVSPKVGHRYFNRYSGEVRTLVPDIDVCKKEWVEICPIDPEIQREEARRFLSDCGVIDVELQSLIDGESWYFDFPNMLKVKHPNLYWRWNRRRSQHVVATAKEWCESNSVDEKLLFADSNDPPKKVEVTVPRLSSSPTALKPLLLQVLARMSTEELLRLSLPAHHLIAVLRPDLIG